MEENDSLRGTTGRRPDKSVQWTDLSEAQPLLRRLALHQAW